MTVLQVALVGCGYMGRHHARTIATHPGCELVAVHDVVRSRAERLAGQFDSRACAELPDDLDAVVVATPTRSHVDVARGPLSRGLWCLVEKPLAATSEESRELVGPRLVVGHVERFNPALRAAGEIRPRFVQTHRLSPPSPRGQDVDVVQDLLIHDLDLLLYWAGDASVELVDASGVRGGAGWDTASVRLRTEDGLTASLTASRTATERVRVAHVFERGRYLTLDLLQGCAMAEGKVIPPLDDADALTAQWAAFVDAVEGRPSSAPRGEAGVRALTLADEVRRTLDGGAR